jgi:hypothetical protein
VSIDPIAPQAASRHIYPKLAQRMTSADLYRLFRPSYEERRWVPTVARTPSSQVALLVQLKIFQAVGRFLPVEEIPQAAIEHVARELGVDEEIRHLYSDSTLYRHHSAVLERLRITAWGAAARELARRTMGDIAQVRTDPADLINAAADALVRHRFELPSLDTLTRLARRVHSQVNTAQWQRVGALLKEVERAALEALLVVDPTTQESPFALICRAPGRATRKNLVALIDRHEWLQRLPDPTAALQPIADAKVLQWANEARRLKAPELREYTALRREALLLAVLRQAQGQVLDDLTQMLLKLVRKIEWKSEQQYDEWYQGRRATTDSLIRAFHDSLIVHDSDDPPARKVERLETLYTAHGGREKLKESCAQHLRHEKQNWRPFARNAFERLRSALLRVAGILPLQATAMTRDLLGFASALQRRAAVQRLLPDREPRGWLVTPRVAWSRAR